jgi:hypothetical protein
MALPGGFFQQLALNGQCFIGSTAATGVDIPIYTATAAHTAVLWNPGGSGVNLVLNTFSAGQADATTPAIAGLGLSYLLNTGSAIGTGAPVVTFTDAIVQNAKIGVGGAKARFGAASISATSFLMSLGASQDSTTPGANIDTSAFNFNGSVIVPPSTLVAVVGVPIAFGQAMAVSISWAEVQIS